MFISFQGSHNNRANSISLNCRFLVQNERLDLRRLRDIEAEVVPDELELLNRIIDTVVELDPDILVGWDVRASSWGYLNARGSHYGSSEINFFKRNIFITHRP